MAREVYLVGIGLGNPATLTGEARAAIERSGALIGAERMLRPFAEYGCRKLVLVKADEVAKALLDDGSEVASALFSGDVGFYSGASLVARHLEGAEGVVVKAIPGVSSAAYLCARLLMPWHDAYLASAHGRECDAAAIARAHAKTILLTGGSRRAQDVCAMLVAAGLGDLPVSVGERLSYDDEAITRGTAAELAAHRFDSLAVMLVENPALGGAASPGDAPSLGGTASLNEPPSLGAAQEGAVAP